MRERLQLLRWGCRRGGRREFFIFYFLFFFCGEKVEGVLLGLRANVGFLNFIGI